MAAAIPSVSPLGQDQFLQLLVTQLQNQDPLEPTTNTEFIAQLAQFSSLQGIQSLGASFDQVLQLQQMTQGTNLVGKKIQYTPAGSSTVETGTVDMMKVDGKNIVLQIGSNQIPLANVMGVLA